MISVPLWLNISDHTLALPSIPQTYTDCLCWISLPCRQSLSREDTWGLTALSAPEDTCAFPPSWQKVGLQQPCPLPAAKDSFSKCYAFLGISQVLVSIFPKVQGIYIWFFKSSFMWICSSISSVSTWGINHMAKLIPPPYPALTDNLLKLKVIKKGPVHDV